MFDIGGNVEGPIMLVSSSVCIIILYLCLMYGLSLMTCNDNVRWLSVIWNH
jgi:hypothetical protein